MTIRNSTITILAALRDGIDPRDGSPLPGDHLCQAGDVVRALFDAVAVLEAAPGAADEDRDEDGDAARSAAATARRPRRGRHGPVSADDETIEVGVAIEEAQAGDAAPDAAAGKSRRSRPANAGQPWREEDDRRLVELFDGGASLTEIATEFARTRGSIRARLVLLGRGDLVGPGPALRYPIGAGGARSGSGGVGGPGPEVPGEAAEPAERDGQAGLVAEPFAPV